MKKNRPVSERRLLGIAGLGWLFDAMDVGILSFIIAALHVEWKLTPQEMSWIGSVNSIGMAVGAFVFGLLADRVGRKYVFYDYAAVFLDRQRVIRFDDDIVGIFSPALFRRYGAWGRASSRIYARIRNGCAGAEGKSRRPARKFLGIRLAGRSAHFVFIIPAYAGRLLY